jgi:GNAT superfamily N-acetyltransferase
MDSVTFIPVVDPYSIRWSWQQVLMGLRNPESSFGVEYQEPRPRDIDSYYKIRSGAIEAGLMYTQEPEHGVLRFAFGLYPECRKQGIGPAVRDACLNHCFKLGAIRAEAEVYASNVHSLGALRSKDAKMKLARTTPGGVSVNGVCYDHLLFALTADEYRLLHKG